MAKPNETTADSSRPATEVLNALSKAKKNLRLYPSNNPIYEKTIEDTFRKFDDFFEFRAQLQLKITRNEILFEDKSIYHGEGKEENLALFFFRDGLREIIFKQAMQMDELQSFMEIISVDFDREDVEDDIVTLLWEKDFANITYTVDESVLIEDEEYEDEASRQAKEDTCEDECLRQAYDEALKSDEKSELALMPVTDADLKSLVNEIEKDSADKTPKLINIVFDMLWQADNREEFKDISSIINNAIDYSLSKRNLNAIIEIIKRTKYYYDKTTSGDARNYLGLVFSHISSAKLIYQVGELLDSVTKLDEKNFQEFVKHLSPSTIEHFVSLLGEMKTVSGRRNVNNALISLGGKNIEVLAKGLRNPKPFVVRNIIYVFRKLGDSSAAEHLMSALNHQDPNVRKDALMAVGELGGRNASPTIMGFLSDPSEPVRITAAKALGKIGTMECRDILISKITNKDLMNAPFEEIKGYFEVLSRWKDDTVTDLIVKIINKKHFFKKAKHDEIKAGAIYCLGMMGSKQSITILDKLRTSGNKLVSDYANAALRRIRYGKQ